MKPKMPSRIKSLMTVHHGSYQYILGKPETRMMAIGEAKIVTQYWKGNPRTRNFVRIWKLVGEVEFGARKDQEETK